MTVRPFWRWGLILGITANIAAGADMKHDKQAGTPDRELQSLYWEAMRTVHPESVPDSIASEQPLPVKCQFSLANRIRARLSQFSSEQRLQLAKFSDRPVMPYYCISSKNHFRIHYTLTGADAVSPVDSDGNGVPDYIDEAAKSLEYAYHVEVDSLKFNPPPADDADGPEWDLYIENISGSYGWTNIDRLVSMDPDVYTSYITLDNDYTQTQTKGLNGLKVSIAHEFFHMIQLGYNARTGSTGGYFADQFLMEASSTWMEDVVYDGINDYYNYLDGFFEQNDIRFDTLDGWREYGLCLWFHFLVKHLDSIDFVRRVWNEILSFPAVEANDHALQQYYGTTFSDELGLFYAWNYRTGSRADSLDTYPEGGAYPEIKADGEFSLDTQSSVNADVVTTGARYYRFQNPVGDRYTFVLTNVRRSDADESDPVSLSLSENAQTPSTKIDAGLYAHASVSQAVNWRNYFCVERSGHVSAMAALNDTIQPTKAESLPASIPSPCDFSKYSFVSIPFTLTQFISVHLYVFSSSGYKVVDKTFEVNDPNLAMRNIGEYKIEWNGLDDGGNPVAGGIYVYAIVADGKVVRREKIAVLR
jgi:hypothetical protein